MAGLLDFIGNNAGSLIGGLLGAASNSGSGKANETTATRDPWGPAQPHILRNLQNEADLQGYYQKTPFNAQQQQGYSNLFGDIGNFRDNVAPGLMEFANRGMTSSYQRQRGGAPGSGGGYGGAVQPGGMGQSGQGPFSVARGAQVQNPMLDLNGAQNPYTNGGIKAPEPKAQAEMAGGGLLGGGVPPAASGNGMAQGDFNPASWSAMGDVEKAQYYADNPTMAALTQALQMGFSLTDISRLQGIVAPEVAERARQIAHGYAFGGGGASFGNVDFGGVFAGMGPGDVSQLGVNLGQFGSADAIASISNDLGGGFFNGGNDPSSGPGGVGGIGIG